MRVWGGKLFPLLFLIGSGIVWASSAYAARVGTVNEEGAEVYEEPSPSAKVIEKLSPKTEIAASNLPLSGFHKVRTPSGNIGWVNQNAISLEPAPSLEELEAAGAPDPREKEKRKIEEEKEAKQSERPGYIPHWVRFRGLGGMTLFRASGIVTQFDNISQGYHYGGEFTVFIVPQLGVSFRAESIFKSIALNDSATGKGFQVDLYSLPVMGGIDYAFIQGPRASVHLGIFGGASIQTVLVSKNLTDVPPPDLESQVITSNLTGLAKIEIDWQFSRILSIFIEGGYRYLVTSAVNPPVNNGSLILNSSFPINLSGLFFGAGIGASF